MSNIIVASITITGTRPLLFHRFSPDAIPLEKRERSGVAGHDPDEWRRTVAVTEGGRLWLDPTQVFACLRDGGRFTPRKRSSLMPLIASTLLVRDEQVLLDRMLPDPPPRDPRAPVYLDVRSVRNPATRALNVRYRIAAGIGWRATFTIEWDRTIVSRNELLAATIDAGRLVGVGDGRAIGFGRFTFNPERDVRLADEAAIPPAVGEMPTR